MNYNLKISFTPVSSRKEDTESFTKLLDNFSSFVYMQKEKKKKEKKVREFFLKCFASLKGHK